MEFINKVDYFLSNWIDKFDKHYIDEINLLISSYKTYFENESKTEKKLEQLQAHLLIIIWYSITSIFNKDSLKIELFCYSYDDFKGVKEDFFKIFKEEICFPRNVLGEFSVLEGIICSATLNQSTYINRGLTDLWMLVDFTDIEFRLIRDKLARKFLDLIKTTYLIHNFSHSIINNKSFQERLKIDLTEFFNRGVSPIDWITNYANAIYFQIYLAIIIFLEDYENILRFDKEFRKSGYFKKYYVIAYFYKQMKEEKNPIFKRGVEKQIFAKLLIKGINYDFFRIYDNQKIVSEKVVNKNENLKGWGFTIHYQSMSILFNRFLEELLIKNEDNFKKYDVEKVASHIEWLYDPDDLAKMEEIKNKFPE